MQSLELENYGAVEMDSTELANVDGGEIVNGYSDASAKSAGKALANGLRTLWNAFDTFISAAQP
jgi:hypothetical protein